MALQNQCVRKYLPPRYHYREQLHRGVVHSLGPVGWGEKGGGRHTHLPLLGAAWPRPPGGRTAPPRETVAFGGTRGPDPSLLTLQYENLQFEGLRGPGWSLGRNEGPEGVLPPY